MNQPLSTASTHGKRYGTGKVENVKMTKKESFVVNTTVRSIFCCERMSNGNFCARKDTSHIITHVLTISDTAHTSIWLVLWDSFHLLFTAITNSSFIQNKELSLFYCQACKTLERKLELPLFSGFTVVQFNQLCQFLQANRRSYIFCKTIFILTEIFPSVHETWYLKTWMQDFPLFYYFNTIIKN